jgi:NADH-quinone oxidoreductase subunit H
MIFLLLVKVNLIFLFVAFVITIFLITLLFLLISVAYYTLVERKVMAAIQHREGPAVVGLWGLLQPLADGLKLFIKEPFSPIYSQEFLFYISPILSLFLSIFGWAGVNFSLIYSFIDINILILFFFVVSSFNVYSVVLAGWSSNSKYALLGAVRSTAQMISYEVSLGFILIIIALYSGSLNVSSIIISQVTCWYFFLIPFLFFMFYISVVAETNRAPFDLPEAEAEIVAGYHVEYGGMGFSLFFLGEYSNMLLMSFLAASFFLGGWHFPFFFSFFSFIFQSYILTFKALILSLSLIILRSVFPRYRYDKLMHLGWIIFLPLTFGFIFFYTSFLYIIECCPFSDSLLFLDKFMIYFKYFN